MAHYQYPEYVTATRDAKFEQIHTPGTVVQHSGIYRCVVCGDEIAANKGNPLPAQNHRQHGLLEGPIRWRLTVASIQV
jgi:hypothetical protein